MAGMTESTAQAPEGPRSFERSEELYRLIADHMTDVVWTMDLEGNFTYVSPSVERLRGYTPEEVIRQSIEEVLAPEAAAEIRRDFVPNLELYRQSRSAKTRRFLEQPCKDGSWVWTEVITNGIYDGEGNLVGILGVSQDVSEQHRIEQELRRAKEAAERDLAEIQTLSGLVPICSHCKKVRDDEGYWKRVEDYLARTGARVSHGICPDCLTRFYPDFRDQVEGEPGGLNPRSTS